MWINTEANPNKTDLQEMEALRVHAEAKYTEPLPNNRRLEVRSRSILASADPSLSSKNDRDGD